MLAHVAAVDNFGAGRTLTRMALATRSDDHSHPDLATKAEVDGQFGQLRVEIAEHRAEQREALAELRGDFTVLGGKVTTLEGEMVRIREEMAEHREETVRLRDDVVRVREEIAELRGELRGSMKLLMWGLGVGFAAMFTGLGSSPRSRPD